MLWEANAQARLERGRATSSQSIALVSFGQDSAQVFSIARSLNDTVPDEVDVFNLDQSPATLQSIELEKPLRRQTLASAINLASGIIATAGNDQTIILYDLASGQVIGEPLTGHADALFSIAISPDGSMMLSGGNGGAIVLWRRDENGTWRAVSDPIPAHESRVMSLEFSPDGLMAASGDSNGEIRLWEVQGDTLTPSGDPLIGHTNTVLSLQFSPDGTKLASGGRDSTIILWDLEKRIGQTLTGHLNMVNSLSFNPAGTMLASGSRDNTVILWDLSPSDGAVRMMGSPFAGHQGFVNSVAFSQDGEWLASGDENGLIITWDVGLKSWRNAACQITNRDMTNDEWVQYLGVFEYHATCSLAQ
jgi:WD40 repeat protein